VRALRRDLITALPRARVSHRLGPGHRDWPLTEQQDLARLFEGNDSPVRLSEHGVLIPFKSISGLFALRPAPNRSLRPQRLGLSATICRQALGSANLKPEEG
jgi:hypothetical protein